MKLKIVLTITGLVLLVANEIKAQVPSFAGEALLISRTQPGGSSRILGMGGVQNSLGGDISSASYNPAGLGMYNRSEFSFTPGYVVTSTSSSYLGNTDNQNKNNLIVPNFGMAFHKGKEGTSGFLGGTFGVSYNRTNDFNKTFSYHGKNNDNSIIDYFIENANGRDESQFESGGYNFNTPTELGYRTFLIRPETDRDPSAPNDVYYTDVFPYQPTQSEIVKTTGSQSQWNFSYGANFGDKLFIGAGINLASFKFSTDATYTETFYDPYPGAIPLTSPMTKMVMHESFNMIGTGVGATLGAIYRPIDLFQLGFSVATPTSYQISTEYSASMDAQWQNFPVSPTVTINDVGFDSDLVVFDHNLSTPWRFSGGGTFFIQKKGLISADVEYVSYGNAKFSSYSDGSSPDVDNKDVKSLYQSVLNIRIGGEYRVKNYRIRAGYSLMPDPYKTIQNDVDNTYNSYSLGFGYRTSKFFIDLAAILGQTNQSYRPYSVPSNLGVSPLVTMKNQSTTVAITVGFPF